MPTVRTFVYDALTEIQVIAAGDPVSAADAALGLRWFQRQIDAWAADRLTLSVQAATSITWPASTSTRTVGPGGQINIQRPVWINQLNYVVPASSPAVESPMAPLNEDQYAQVSIKGQQSGLPQQFFYQTSLDTVLGSLFIWPQPTGSITLKLYTPQAVTVPVTLDDVLIGPPGYQDAFHYQLSIRLCTPFGRPVPELLPTLARNAYTAMTRQNVDPGLLGTDAALVSVSGGYNILSDSASAPSAR